jgi:2-polyprenyl-3-methyl-5-hydroxy-6-metoxy-1,4-benzoquinol methylase
MSPAEVAQSYDVLAPQWAGPDFHRDNGISQHLRALQFIAQPGEALDVGCGSSGRFIDLLIERGFEVEGIDISAEMIRLARQRHPQIVFHHANLVEWTPPQAYDFISAWDSVWHVPLTSQEAVWTKLLHTLSPGGVMILSTGGLDTPQRGAKLAYGRPHVSRHPRSAHLVPSHHRSGLCHSPPGV